MYQNFVVYLYFKIKVMDREKIYDLYMKWVDEVAEECEWKTNFTPKEIVCKICQIIEDEEFNK
jgi:hypothetical protein